MKVEEQFVSIPSLVAQVAQADKVQAIRKEHVASLTQKIEALIANSKLGKALAQAEKELAEAKEHAAEVETNLCRATMANFNETGERKPATGVEVQRRVTVNLLNRNAAIQYVLKAAPALVKTTWVNKRTFNSELRRRLEKTDPQGAGKVATLIENLQVVLKKKLWKEES